MVLALHGRHCPEKNHAFLKRKNWKPVSTWLSLHSQTPLKISKQRPLVQFYWAPDIFSCFRFKNQITKSSWFRCMLKEKSFSSSGDHSGHLNTRCKLHVPGVNFTHPIFLPCWFMSVVIFSSRKPCMGEREGMNYHIGVYHSFIQGLGICGVCVSSYIVDERVLAQLWLKRSPM